MCRIGAGKICQQNRLKWIPEIGSETQSLKTSAAAENPDKMRVVKTTAGNTWAKFRTQKGKKHLKKGQKEIRASPRLRTLSPTVLLTGLDDT
jgi:hypothetical protein